MSKLLDGFGKRLKEQRKRLDLTQTEFAEQAGIKRVTQFLYENETNSPNVRYLKAIEDIGVDLHYLIFGYSLQENRYHLDVNTLTDIYYLVDEIAVDQKGKPLPVETRAEYLCHLCAAFSGKTSDKATLEIAKAMLR